MKTILSVATVIMALSAGATLAQQPSDAPSPAPNALAPESPPPAQQAAPPSDEDRPRSDWHRAHGERPMAYPRAARFYVQDGDVKIRMKCAEDEPTKVCADLLLQMLDRLEGSSSSRGDRDRDHSRDRDSDD